jgi:ADP-heptose:LPS heptosyltransferase
MTPLPVRKVRKIAIFRPNALGDFIFCLPALRALRAAYPGAELVYLGQQWHAEFLHGRAGPVDRVVVVPPLPGIGLPAPDENGAPNVDGPTATERVRGPAGEHAQEAGPENEAEGAMHAFVTAMRRERFDLALQMYGGGRHANPLLQRFGARLTVGMQSADAVALDRCLPYRNLVNRRLQLLDVAALAGAQSLPLTTSFQASKADRALAAELLPPLPGERLVLFHPGASDPRRRWPAPRFAALGDALCEQGAQVAINGSAAEAGLAAEVAGLMRSKAIDLSGQAGLPALCGLLQRAALLVSNDTGPLHLALEMGTRCVGIYWFTNMLESAPLAQGAHAAALSLRVHCPVCGLANIEQRCAHDASFVDQVTLEHVTALASGMLRQSA